MTVLTSLRVHVTLRPESVKALTHGACLVVANHTSFVDGIIFAVASPVPLHFVSEIEMSVTNRWTSFGMRCLAWMGFGSVIPLDKNSPHGIRTVLAALRAGENVFIFPDGCITGQAEIVSPMQGVEWVRRRVVCTVIEARIIGAEAHRLFAKEGRAWFPRIRVML